MNRAIAEFQMSEKLAKIRNNSFCLENMGADPFFIYSGAMIIMVRENSEKLFPIQNNIARRLPPILFPKLLQTSSVVGLSQNMHEIMSSREPTLDLTLHASIQRTEGFVVEDAAHAALKRAKEIEAQSQSCSDSDDDEDLLQLSPRRSSGLVGRLGSGNRKRCVDFHGRVRVMEIHGRSDLTEVDRASLWYSSEEMTEMADAHDYMVSLMIREKRERFSPVDDDDSDVTCNPLLYCTYGLRTPKEDKACNFVMMEALQAVLYEQDMQWKHNIEDPEHLADIYFEYTCENQRQAFERGMSLADGVDEDNRPIEQETDTDYNENPEPMTKIPDNDCTHVKAVVSSALAVYSEESKMTAKTTEKPENICKLPSDSSIDSRSLDLNKARSLFSGQRTVPSYSTTVNSPVTNRSNKSIVEQALGIVKRNPVSEEEDASCTMEEALGILNSDSEDEDESCSSYSLEENHDNDSSMNIKWEGSFSNLGGDCAPCAPPRKASINEIRIKP